MLSSSQCRYFKDKGSRIALVVLPYDAENIVFIQLQGLFVLYVFMRWL